MAWVSFKLVIPHIPKPVQKLCLCKLHYTQNNTAGHCNYFLSLNLSTTYAVWVQIHSNHAVTVVLEDVNLKTGTEPVLEM
jgi:hypothetical protein